VNQQAFTSNVDRPFEKVDLCAIISKEFPGESMHCMGDCHEDGVIGMNFGRLQGCDRWIDGEAILGRTQILLSNTDGIRGQGMGRIENQKSY
jgi:hypothetical protein